jgi:hypothetical protein
LKGIVVIAREFQRYIVIVVSRLDSLFREQGVTEGFLGGVDPAEKLLLFKKDYAADSMK